MHMLLIFHIIGASALTVGTAALFLLGIYRKSYDAAKSVTKLSLVATALSGIALVTVAGGIGRFCAMMTIYTCVALLAERFYAYRSVSTDASV